MIFLSTAIRFPTAPPRFRRHPSSPVMSRRPDRSIVSRPRSTVSLAAATLLGLLLAVAAHGQAHDQAVAIGPGIAPPDLVFAGDALDNHLKFTDARADDVLFPVMVNNWWGHMNQRGRLVVFPQFEWTDHSYEGFARAVIDGKTGFLLGNGQWRIDPVFPYADRFAEGYAVVGDPDAGRYGFIHKSDRALTPLRFDGALRFKEGYAAVRVGEGCGFIDTRGRIVIEPRFVRVRSFHEGFAMVELPGEADAAGPLGYINKRGRFVMVDRQGRFEELGDFEDGYARAKANGGWGYIDRGMAWRIEPRFEDARDFTNGAAAVKIDGAWGYIDKRGRVIIEPRFDGADDFDDTLAMVRQGERYGFVDRGGRMILAAAYERAEPVFRNYARIALEPAFGYATVSGKLIWDPVRAERGFVNTTARERASVVQRRHHTHNRIIPPPEPRSPTPPPYPPEYLYEEELRVPREPATEGGAPPDAAGDADGARP